MPFVQIQYTDIYFDPKVQQMCVTPAFRCPNYEHSWSCPPAAPYMEDELSKYKEFYLVYSRFDLESYIKKVKAKRPKKTEYQIRNSYYMKSFKLNKLEEEMDKFLEQYDKSYKKKRILYDGSCRFCQMMKAGNCTYDSGEPCRFPEEKRYSMEAVGIEVIKTVIELNLDIEYPSNKYAYRFGLACFQ